MVREFLSKVPVPTAGLALGIVALGKLLATFGLTTADHVLAVVALVFELLVIGKLVTCPKVLFSELRNQPVNAAVFGTFFMTIMQLTTYIVDAAPMLARVLWVLAVTGHFALMAWFTVERLRAPRITDVFATWFVCYIGIIVACITCVPFGWSAFGQAIFWPDFILYLALIVLVTVRYAKSEVPTPAKPSLCIYAAPMSLSIAGYTSCFAVPDPTLLIALEIAAQGLFLFVLTQLPRLIRGGFFPSFAAMTFPFVITATALGKSLGVWAKAGLAVPDALHTLQVVEVAFACVMVVFVTIRYAGMFLGQAKATTAPATSAERA